MMFETCEARKMFAVTADAFHSTLYVWGDNNGNGISVEKSGSDLVVKTYTSGMGYTELFRKPDSYVQQIRIYGYDGADTITIADNVTDPATIMGGRGADFLKAGGGQTNVYGHGTWTDDPSGSHRPATDDSAADSLVSGAGYSILSGQKGNDSFFTTFSGPGATTQYDILYGGEGHDKFYTTGRRQAYAFGEAGNDTLYAGQQKTVFHGGTGSDSADFGDYGQSVYVKPDGVTLSGRRTGIRDLVLNTDIETVLGTQWNDYFSGSSGVNYFYGREGNDSIYGNGGNDVLVGNDGNDKIYGGDGNDLILGDNGGDTLHGDAGNDTIHGGNNSDDIHGGSGHDVLRGENDSDWIYGDSGNDTLVGGAAADFLHSHDGVFGNDIIYGDNTDGTGAGGALDVAYIDRSGPFPWQFDLMVGVESSSW